MEESKTLGILVFVFYPFSGEVIFKVNFQALVFKPYKGEILDGVVSDVTSDGIFIESGPLKSFISKAVSIFHPFLNY